MARQYSSTAVTTTLSSTIVAGTTSIAVGSVTNWPTSYPYTIIIDPDVVGEEVCTVTNAVGTTLTVTRGVDGTTATGHNSGAVVKHGVSARDFSEPQVHIDATVAHGATGAVVGTTNTQTLTNKTVDGASNTLSNIPKTAVTGTAVTLADTGTVTSTMILDGTIVNGDINAAAAIAVSKLASSSVTIGGTAATLGGANVTSLTGVTLDSTSTIGGVSGTTISADHAAWTNYTPALSGTGWALGNGTAVGRYIQVGKVVHFNATITLGTTSTFGTGQATISLPVASRNSESQGRGISVIASNYIALHWQGASSTVASIFGQCSASINANVPMIAMNSTNFPTLTSTNYFWIHGTYEAA